MKKMADSFEEWLTNSNVGGGDMGLNILMTFIKIMSIVGILMGIAYWTIVLI